MNVDRVYENCEHWHLLCQYLNIPMELVVDFQLYIQKVKEKTQDPCRILKGKLPTSNKIIN